MRQAATLVNSKVGKIDVLINNAGIAGQKACEKTVDGVEKHFAANYLGHFLFTNLVLGKVKEGKGTVINVTSMAYTLAEVDVKDVSFAVSLFYISPWPLTSWINDQAGRGIL